jgi:hypothetical protein
LTLHEWTAICLGVEPDVCHDVAVLFINNLAWNWDWVLDQSGGQLAVEPRPECPAVPDWADPSFCWQAVASVTDGTVCMVVAHQYVPRNFGYGQVGGDDMSDRAAVPGHEAPPCV